MSVTDWVKSSVCAGVVFTAVSVACASANAALIDFGSVPINTTVSTPSVVTFTPGFIPAAFSGTAGTPPFTLDARGCAIGPPSCTITESFSPTALGLFTATLTLTECKDGSCIDTDFAIRGTGISVLQTQLLPISFGDVPIGTTATLQVTLPIDVGYVIASLAGTFATAPFSFNPGNCTQASVGSCVFEESFTPTVQGPATAFLTIPECANNVCIETTVNITGNGTLVTRLPEPGTIGLLTALMAVLAVPRAIRRRAGGVEGP